MATTITTTTKEMQEFHKLHKIIKKLASFSTFSDGTQHDFTITGIVNCGYSVEVCMIIQIALELAIADNFRKFREAV